MNMHNLNVGDFHTVWEFFQAKKGCQASHCCCTRVTDGEKFLMYSEQNKEDIVRNTEFSAFTAVSFSRWSHDEVKTCNYNSYGADYRSAVCLIAHVGHCNITMLL